MAANVDAVLAQELHKPVAKKVQKKQNSIQGLKIIFRQYV